jgi:hypothetical protein
MTVGKPFPPPPIEKGVLFGGWELIKGNSEFITLSLGIVLDSLKADGVNLGTDAKIVLSKSAAQVVNGLNIYIQFELQMPPHDVQAEIYFPSFLNGKHAPRITKIYAGEK